MISDSAISKSKISNKSSKRSASAQSGAKKSSSKRSGSSQSNALKGSKSSNNSKSKDTTDSKVIINSGETKSPSVDLSKYYSKDMIEVMIPNLFKCIQAKYQEKCGTDGICSNVARAVFVGPKKEDNKKDLSKLSLIEQAKYLSEQFCESDDAEDLIDSITHAPKEKHYTMEEINDGIVDNGTEMLDLIIDDKVDENEFDEDSFSYDFMKNGIKSHSTIRNYISRYYTKKTKELPAK